MPLIYFVIERTAYHRAIALSLQESKGSTSQPSQSHGHLIGLDEQELQFQRDLEAAVAASQAESSTRHAPVASRELSDSSQTQEDNPATAFLRERAVLEKQRLERLKRSRNEHPAESSTQGTKRARVSPHPSGPILKSSDVIESEKHWDGELRQTANRFVDKDKDSRPTFRISEIIGPVSVVF